MTSFEHIAAVWDTLFPARDVQIDFVENTLPDGAPARWVDVACGAGAHFGALFDRGRDVYGVDLEPAMIERLGERYPDLASRAAVGDMRTVDELVPKLFGGPIGVVYCIGNSLALLPSRDDVRRSLGAFFRLVAPGGAIAAQVVNYDRFLDRPDQSFPVLEREHKEHGAIRFERWLGEPLGDGRRAFCSRLTVGEDALERTSEVCMLRQRELAADLAAAGFDDVRFFGDYTETDWSADTPATIFRARRP